MLKSLRELAGLVHGRFIFIFFYQSTKIVKSIEETACFDILENRLNQYPERVIRKLGLKMNDYGGIRLF